MRMIKRYLNIKCLQAMPSANYSGYVQGSESELEADSCWSGPMQTPHAIYGVGNELCCTAYGTEIPVPARQ